MDVVQARIEFHLSTRGFNAYLSDILHRKIYRICDETKMVSLFVKR
jgi:hypothetical protein